MDWAPKAYQSLLRHWTHSGGETQPLVGQGSAALLLTGSRHICSAHGTLTSLHGAQTDFSLEQWDWDLGLTLGVNEVARHRFRSVSATSTS